MKPPLRLSAPTALERLRRAGSRRAARASAPASAMRLAQARPLDQVGDHDTRRDRPRRSRGPAAGSDATTCSVRASSRNRARTTSQFGCSSRFSTRIATGTPSARCVPRRRGCRAGRGPAARPARTASRPVSGAPSGCSRTSRRRRPTGVASARRRTPPPTASARRLLRQRPHHHIVDAGGQIAAAGRRTAPGSAVSACVISVAWLAASNGRAPVSIS